MFRALNLAIVSVYALTLAVAGCASLITGKPDVKPDGPGQISVSAYATIDKAVIAVKRIAPTKTVSADRLQKVLEDAKGAREALDAAQGSLAVGDLQTTLGKLQAAQMLLASLSAFLAAHPLP